MCAKVYKLFRNTSKMQILSVKGKKIRLKLVFMIFTPTFTAPNL
jgi:hypothetical protein